jgi:hypothetical protein
MEQRRIFVRLLVAEPEVFKSKTALTENKVFIA